MPLSMDFNIPGFELPSAHHANITLRLHGNGNRNLVLMARALDEAIEEGHSWNPTAVELIPAYNKILNRPCP